MPTDTIAYYNGLSSFAANPEVMTAAMYHKNDTIGIYVPSLYSSWSTFYTYSASNTNAATLLSVYEPMRVLFYK